MQHIYAVRRLIYIIYINIFNCVMKITPFSFLRILLLKLSGSKIGKKNFIAAGVRFDFPWRLTIGNNCYISKGVYFDCRGGQIILENNIDISEAAFLYTLSHDINSNDFRVKKGDLKIQDRVWVCARSIILPKTEIKKGCVIGANSVINGSTKDFGLYVGVPALFLRQLDETRSLKIRNNNG